VEGNQSTIVVTVGRSIGIRRMDSALTNPEPKTDFIWRAHPAGERPLAACFGGLIVLAIATAAAVSYGPWWGVISLIFLFLALNRFFLPSRFTMNATGIVARFPFREQRLAWTSARRFLHDSHGGFLSTRSVASRLDAFSGFHILFGRERDHVIRMIQTRIAQSQIESSAAGISIDDSTVLQEHRA